MSSRREPVGIALLGAGRMGAVHARILQAAVPEVALRAVGDVSLPAAEAAAGAGAVAYRDPGRALDHPEVEACLIASPTPTHAELTAAALDRGLHVLCEKPLTLDPDESERLGRRAAAAGLVLQVGLWRRHSPPWVEARRLISTGAIGRPVLVRLSQWDASAPPPAFCDPAVSGGLLIDCGIHEFDLAEWLTGATARRITSRDLPLAHPELADVGDVDNSVTVVDLDDGSAAVIDLSRSASYGDDVRTEILGTSGALFIETIPHGRLWLGDAAGRRGVDAGSADDATEAGVARQAAAFAGAIRSGSGGTPDAFDSARAHRLARAAGASARRGSPVAVGNPSR